MKRVRVHIPGGSSAHPYSNIVRSFPEITLGHYSAWPKVADAVVKARSSFSYWPKCRATALYESGAARKRHALRGSVRDGHARDCWVFSPCAPFLLTAYVSVFSHDFKRFERLTKLATSS